MKNLNNYRQLKPNEIIRKGDYFLPSCVVGTEPLSVKWSIGSTVKAYTGTTYQFFRRRHTAKTVTIVIPQPKPEPKKQAAKKVMVEFRYPNSEQPEFTTQRHVQLISLDGRYLTGVERTQTRHGINWQFKRFSRSKIRNGEINILSYE